MSTGIIIALAAILLVAIAVIVRGARIFGGIVLGVVEFFRGMKG